MPTILNVGGGYTRTLPAEYEGWQHILLDIDPAVKPDIKLDAREMKNLPADAYDGIYCTHVLEHFSPHEAPLVVSGFWHVLKPQGRVHVIVPDVVGALKFMLDRNLDINDVWYRTGDNLPITFHDVIYGWGLVLKTGNPYYAHKSAFTGISLGGILHGAGFDEIQICTDGSNLEARALKKKVIPCE